MLHRMNNKYIKIKDNKLFETQINPITKNIIQELMRNIRISEENRKRN